MRCGICARGCRTSTKTLRNREGLGHETENEASDLLRSAGDCGHCALRDHRRGNRAASVELAAAATLRMARDYLLAGAWHSGAQPNPLRGMRIRTPRWIPL